MQHRARIFDCVRDTVKVLMRSYHSNRNNFPTDQSKLLPSSAAYRSPSSKNQNTHSSLTSRAQAFFRYPLRAQSGASLHSSYSGGATSLDSTQTSSDTRSADSFSVAHPYSAMVSAPVPVVSSNEMLEDEDQCPVCLEPLSFKLPGEKPHIVPDCGHALHEVSLDARQITCFCSIYHFY